MTNELGMRRRRLENEGQCLLVLCARRRFVAIFTGCGLRDEAARVETVFFERASFFAAARPLALPPLRDLDALLAGILLRDAAAFEGRFLEVLVFLTALRPRALAPPRPLEEEVLFLGDLAIYYSSEGGPS